MAKHDPSVDTVLVRYPSDHPALPSAEFSIHPANGRSSVQNARGVHPDAVILRWERDSEPYVEGDPDNGEEFFVNPEGKAAAKAAAQAANPNPAGLDPDVSAAVANQLAAQDTAAHEPGATKKDQPATPAAVADALASAGES